jgi:hypothetical protein
MMPGVNYVRRRYWVPGNGWERRAVPVPWPTEPACWSWPVPELPDAEEVPLVLARYGVPLRQVGGSASQVAHACRFALFHNHQCAICGTVDHLVVDHDYRSKRVRGFLCNPCNSNEGRAWAAAAPAFVGYRRRHPARILDYQDTYGEGARCRPFVDAQCRGLGRVCTTMTYCRLALTELHLGIAAAADPALMRTGHRLEQAWAELEVLLARPSPTIDIAAVFECLWFRLDLVIDTILKARLPDRDLLDVAELAFLPLRDLRRRVDDVPATVET